MTRTVTTQSNPTTQSNTTTQSTTTTWRTSATTDWRTMAAIVTTVVAWASAFVSIRSAGHDYTAGALALGRMLVATIAVMALLVVRREGLPDRRAWPGILIGGVLWFGLYMVALNWAEQRVDAGTAAMLIGIGPIVIALLSARLLGEGLPRLLIAGLAVAFAGTVLVGYSQSGGGSAPILGVLACLVWPALLPRSRTPWVSWLRSRRCGTPPPYRSPRSAVSSPPSCAYHSAGSSSMASRTRRPARPPT
jgi:drug/metabolite transporter (DMT)-like permease